MGEPVNPQRQSIARIRDYVRAAARRSAQRTRELWALLRRLRLLGPAVALLLAGVALALLSLQPFFASSVPALPQLMWIVLALIVLVPRLQALRLITAEDIKDWADYENSARQTLLQIGGGLLLVAGVITAWWQYRDSTQVALRTLDATNRNLELTRESQQHDRFSRALDQLGSNSMSSRIAGVFALERMLDQPGTQPWDVAEILAAFVRTQAGRQDRDRRPASPKPLPKVPRWPMDVDPAQPPADVQAALTVLGRNAWPPGFEAIAVARADVVYRRVLDLRQTDLRGANLGAFQARTLKPGSKDGLTPRQLVLLAGADLRRATMVRAHLPGAQLERAWLDQAWLGHAMLAGANLKGATLISAALRDADLRDADLSGVDARNADFSDANLGSAQFFGADLRGADLTAYSNFADFTGANVAGALFNRNILQARIAGAKGLAEATVEGVPLAGFLRTHRRPKKQ